MEMEAAAEKEKPDRTVDRRPMTVDYAIAFVAAMNVARGSKPIDS